MAPPDYPDPLAEPPGGWPTQPRRLGDGLVERTARARAAWERAIGTPEGRAQFYYEPQPHETPASQEHDRWLAILGGPEHATWRLHNLEGAPAERAEHVEAWLDSTSKRPKPLVLSGQTGRGKTTLAAAAAFAWWHGGGRPVVWADVALLLRDADPQLLGRLRNAFDKTLVVLDNLEPGTQRFQSFSQLVRQVVGTGCRLLVTTRMGLSALRDPDQLADDVRSRLGNNLVELAGPDLRERGSGVPAPPDAEPCPVDHEGPGFELGALFGCRHAEVRRVALDVIEAECRKDGPWPYYGLTPPDQLAWPDLPQAEAEATMRAAWDRWDRAVEHHHGTWRPCPWCAPERCLAADYLDRVLATSR